LDHTFSLDYLQVRDEYLKMMGEQIKLTTANTKCSEAMIWDVLGLASVTRSSIHASCAELEEAPTGEGVRYQLRAGWLKHRELGKLEDELNDLLGSRLPQGIVGRSQSVAMDLTFIPYHGEAQDRAEEVRRGKAKSGTTHFHVYASAYIIRKQKRVTLAVAYWQAGQALLEVFLRLLLRLSIIQIDINRLLLDRQFCTVAMIRCLQACPWQSVMPVPARSNMLKELKQSARRSQIIDYTMRSPTDGEVTFPLHAVCRYARGRRGNHGIECLPLPFWY
jgi:hypothetical protein